MFVLDASGCQTSRSAVQFNESRYDFSRTRRSLISTRSITRSSLSFVMLLICSVCFEAQSFGERIIVSPGFLAYLLELSV